MIQVHVYISDRITCVCTFPLHTDFCFFTHVTHADARTITALCMMADRQDQLDEVEFLQAMMSKDGEFEWREDPSTGTISGTLSVFLQLDGPFMLRLVRKRKSEVKVRSFESEAAKVSTGNKAYSRTVDSLKSDTSGEAIQRSQLSVSKVSSMSAPTSPKHPRPPTLPELVQVLYLPPLILHFQFPPSYPSWDKPVFSLSCKWLNFTQVSSVSYKGHSYL